MKKAVLTFIAILSFGLTACQGSGPKQTIGTGVGAVGGGLLGSQIGSGSGRLWATGTGVLLGALAGSEVGASLDRADRTYMQQAQQRAYTTPIGEPIYWNNPQSGNSGSYVVTRTGTTASGYNCREYRQTVVVGGRTQEGFGTACQRPDGSWEIMN